MKHQYAVPQKATKAIRQGENVYIYCPVMLYGIRHTGVRGAITPSYFGGYEYFAEDNFPSSHVWVVCKTNATKNCDLLNFDVLQDQNISFSSENVIALPDEIRDYPQWKYSIDGEPEHMYPNLILISTINSNSISTNLLSYTVAVFVDLPLSIVMTLTGSFWTIPFSHF